MRKSKYYLVTIFAIAFIMFLSACGGDDVDMDGNDSGADDDSSDKQVFNMNEPQEIPTGDPSLATDAESFIVFGQTMEGLYRLDENDKPEPAIADGEPEVSEDGTEYTFDLREDAEWSNGDPVTADDFVYSWQRAVDPETASEYAYMFEDVVKNAGDIMNDEKDPDELAVEAEDDYTLKVELDHAVEYFDSLLAFGTYLPLNEDFVEDAGDDFGTNGENMLANGPFELVDWDGSSSNSWTYEKNDHYYDEDSVDLDEINVDVAKKPSTSVNMYETGDTDRTGALTAEYAKQYKDDEDATTFEEGNSWYLKFNQERDGEETPLANKHIRKALAMAYDKEEFTEDVLANGSVPMDGFVPKGLAENPETGEDFRDDSGDLISKDIDKAQEEWKKGLDELGKDELTLDYLTDDTENAERQAEYFQNQLEENLDGLSIDLDNVPFKVRLDRTSDQDYDIVMHGWGPDYLDPLTFLDLFVTDGTNNETGYSNEEYDELIQEAEVKYANDPEKRWDKMLEAEKLLVEEDTVIAPIYQRGRIVLQKPYVEGIDEHLFGPDYTMKNITIDK